MLAKWNTILMAIASVSLFVGGIGLFSTLLISISERMNEIGIRKSIGASDFDIFTLLLSEAIILTLIGATIGISLAKLIVVLISKAMHVPLVLPFQGVLVGLGFALLIGVLSGIYPAYKASKVNPIEAVYYFD
jgi:putative ABC transport system permease protein